MPLHQTPPPPRFVRAVVEILIIVGMVGVGGMVAWQGFGQALWDKANARNETVTVEGDCVGGLCVKVELAQATPGRAASVAR